MKLSILARNIKEYRMQAGLTQAELAKRMNVSQNAVSSWETDRTEPNFEQAYKLCGILNVDISTLTGTQPSRKTEITIADVYQKIKTPQKMAQNRAVSRVQTLSSLEKCTFCKPHKMGICPTRGT